MIEDYALIFVVAIVGLIYIAQRAAYFAAISNQKAYEEAKKKAQKRYIDALYGREPDDS